MKHWSCPEEPSLLMIVEDCLFLWSSRVFVNHGCSCNTIMMNDTLTEHEMLQWTSFMCVKILSLRQEIRCGWIFGWTHMPKCCLSRKLLSLLDTLKVIAKTKYFTVNISSFKQKSQLASGCGSCFWIELAKKIRN